MIPSLREFQAQLTDRARAAFYTHRRVLLVSPTGSGKTVMFCWLVMRALSKGKRVYIVAHRIEIVEQIGAALSRFGVPHGWIAPGHSFQEQPIMVGMVQSVSRRLDKLSAPDLLVVDEAHHASASTYRAVASAWPAAYILGASASPARTDGQGLSDCFDAMVIGPSVRELMARGYLAEARCFAPPVMADLSGLAVRAGDFRAEQVAAAMDHRAVTGDACRYYAKALAGKPAVAFCASVAHAEHVAEQFREAGWQAASVDGAMALKERQDRIAAIGDGRLNVLTSCDVISEGTDIPIVSGAILLRPTQSLIVHMQQVGRVLRPKPDGSPAIIHDHASNIVRHGLPDADREWTLEGRAKRPTAPPVRQCDRCYAAFAPAPKCPECGHVFPIAAKPRDTRERDGELSEIQRSDVDARTRWLTEAPLRDLLRGANSVQGLQEIAKARGYKHGWVIQMMKIKRISFGGRSAA